jgi:hypothetical protein
MEKTLEILERYVQWIALGIGVLFLGWVGYKYVLTPPAQVVIDLKPAVAGEVAVVTNNGPVKRVKQALGDTRNPGFATPDIVTSWRSRMDQPAVAMVLPWQFDTLIPTDTGTIKDQGPGAVNIASLPVLPKADPQPPITGLSVVSLQVAALAAAGGAQQVAQPATEDLDWVTAWATISSDALKEAFAKPLAGQIMPPELAAVYKTCVLGVTLQRQHATGVDTNGKPIFPAGNQGIEEVQPLLVYNGTLQKIPADSADIGDKYNFLKWAQTNAGIIATPDFYVVSAGTPWTAPQPDAAPATQPGAAPAAPGVAPAPAPAAQPKAAAVAPVRTLAAATFAPSDLGRQPGAFGVPGGAPQGGFVNAPGQPMALGDIDVSTLTAPLTIWAHDETVKPGETYRYRFIYTLKSPVFGAAGMAKPELIGTLSIASPASNWSDPVTTPEKTKFWLANVNQDKAKFDLFQWSNGAWKLTKPTLTAGDLVPGTNWTVVDVRAADVNRQRDKYVLLTDEVADMSRRDQSSDASDPKHQDLTNEVNGPPAAPTDTAPPPPTRPPPRGRLPSKNGLPNNQ